MQLQVEAGAGTLFFGLGWSACGLQGAAGVGSRGLQRTAQLGQRAAGLR
eukprot:COSAG02_NODE_38808_length_424_cov_1.584615_1_plen_48_part_10